MARLEPGNADASDISYTLSRSENDHMKFDFNIIAKSVPAVFAVCGFIGVFMVNSASGWAFVLIGALLQVLYLVTRNR